MSSSYKDIKSFKNLKVWQKGREVRMQSSKLAKNFPGVEKFRLKDQIIKASKSVTANIAGGYGRFHYQGNIQFCRQASGSLYELPDHLTCALDEEYSSEEQANNIHKQITSYKIGKWLHFLFKES